MNYLNDNSKSFMIPGSVSNHILLILLSYLLLCSSSSMLLLPQASALVISDHECYLLTNLSIVTHATCTISSSHPLNDFPKVVSYYTLDFSVSKSPLSSDITKCGPSGLSMSYLFSLLMCPAFPSASFLKISFWFSFSYVFPKHAV